MNTYEHYAIVYAKIAELTVELEDAKAAIIQEMIEKGDKKVVKANGSFTVSQRKTWTYPKEIICLEEDLKAEKAKAQSCGDATFVEKPSLLFSGIKL